MTYIMLLLLMGIIIGLVFVASNPSPYFGALGLVAVASVGCGILVNYGGSFLSLVLFLIYLGGMLVVFAYSAALAADPFPEGLGNWFVKLLVVVYIIGITSFSFLFSGKWHEFSWVPVDEISEFSVFRGDVGGVALIYSFGGIFLIIGA